VSDSTPLTESEIKSTQKIVEKIEALVDQLPKNVEYSITIGFFHIHNGGAVYLLMTAAEMIARMCRNIAEKDGVGGMMATLPIMMVQASIMRLVGPTAVEVARKYGMEIEESPEDLGPVKKGDVAKIGFKAPGGDANA